MPFGKYGGLELADVPRQYLRWLRRQPWLGAWLVREIDAVLSDKAATTEDETFEEMLEKWRREHLMMKEEIERNEVMKTLTDRLREIVSREPWNLDDLAEWADWFSYWFEADDDEDKDEDVGRWRKEAERLAQQVGRLKPLVGPYWHDPDLPALPDPPDGELHGIGFIYDEDRDDRVLVAIDTLKDKPGLVATAFRVM
jgi:hypothetical protein